MDILWSTIRICTWDAALATRRRVVDCAATVQPPQAVPALTSRSRRLLHHGCVSTLRLIVIPRLRKPGLPKTNLCVIALDETASENSGASTDAAVIVNYRPRS